MLPAISVENLCKAYRIGLKEEIPSTIASAAKGWLTAPLRNLRGLTSLNTFKGDENAEDLHWALRDVSFEVQHGDVVGIIGHNGAGKSTLLKILSRITQPTSGRAVIKGRVSSLLEVGTGFHPELSGRENIYMNGTILGMRKSEIDRKFEEIVDFSGVEKFLDTPIKRYSSGMKVRLAFAVAAHLEPEILVIDEVLAVGDQEFQNKCLGKMQDVAQGGRTVLFVSHNMAAVNRLCKRCVLLDRGEVCRDAKTAEVLQNYLLSTRISKQLLRDDQLIEICTVESGSTSVIRVGDEILIRGTVRHSAPLHDVVIGVGIESVDGTRIATVASAHEKSIAKWDSKQKEFCVKLDSVAFCPGIYNLTVAIRSREGLTADVQNAFRFEVHDQSFYQTGAKPNPRAGAILLKSTWETS